MPTQEEPNQDQSVELEKKTEEIPAEDADTISGGFGKSQGGD